jgi:hypothetical protein
LKQSWSLRLGCKAWSCSTSLQLFGSCCYAYSAATAVKSRRAAGPISPSDQCGRHTDT